MRSNNRGLHVATLHKNFVKTRQALVAQGIIEIVPDHPLIIKTSSCTRQKMIIPKEMKVETCLAAHASSIDPQDAASQEQGIALEDSVNATQFYMASESMKQILERR